MFDNLRFTQELLDLRRRFPALHGQGFRVADVHDRLVVVHLADFTRVGYRLGFPAGGDWREVFNSDAYENWINAGVAGNSGRVTAGPQPLHGFAYSAAVVLPANSMLIFAR